jgi:hypothetical protein
MWSTASTEFLEPGRVLLFALCVDLGTRWHEIGMGGQQKPRCFTLKLKEELYNGDPTCAICGQKIQNIDDAAVDHIEQYWVGGKTIPENARLAHRYCNWARSRKE